jgi:ketosteroid isomerase-like protein
VVRRVADAVVVSDRRLSTKGGSPSVNAAMNESEQVARPRATRPTGARDAASRKLVAKAKQSTPQASKAERERVLTVFRAAYEAGDLAGLVKLLDPDVVYVTDGGGQVSAARRLIHGGERVAEVMLRVGRQLHLERIDFAEVGGELALVFHRDGRVYAVDTVQITDGRITAYRRVMNPDKLERL